jgi:hypothetical protein
LVQDFIFDSVLAALVGRMLTILLEGLLEPAGHLVGAQLDLRPEYLAPGPHLDSKSDPL